jgi:hypothetical protein
MYSAHFSPETFPVDTSVFTGKISKHRMLHEHPLEYARLLEEEKLAAEAAAMQAAVDAKEPKTAV